MDFWFFRSRNREKFLARLARQKNSTFPFKKDSKIWCCKTQIFVSPSPLRRPPRFGKGGKVLGGGAVVFQVVLLCPPPLT